MKWSSLPNDWEVEPSAPWPRVRVLRSPMRHVSIASLIATHALALAVSCASAQVAADRQPTVTVADLTSRPDRFAGADVKVVGRLTGEGNYFSRKRKIVLLDQDRRLEVIPWLAWSTPPPRSDTDRQQPTMADFLDERVELRGRLRQSGDADATWRFEVMSARILPP
jgi:hypothetical protein